MREQIAGKAKIDRKRERKGRERERKIDERARMKTIKGKVSVKSVSEPRELRKKLNYIY